MHIEDGDRESVVGSALRLALAEKLSIDPRELEGLETEAAAAALRHFVVSESEGESTDLPQLVSDRGSGEQSSGLIADGVRAALAYELGVDADRVGSLNVVGAARALDRIRSRRLAREYGDVPGARAAMAEDDQALVTHVLHQSLAEHLDLPPGALAGMPVQLAAHILARLLELRARADAREVGGEQPSDRRDLVARVVRDAIAQDIEVHPRLLGSLDPTAAALLLGRFAQARQAIEVLRSNIATDEMTEALRRSAGEVELEREMGRVRRTGNGKLAVAFLDVDRLKLVNDTYGHSAGDDLLRSVVATLQHRLRAYDSVARWGGDEFLVILPQTDLDDARSIMNEVLRSFAERTHQTFSFGLAALEAEDTGATLVRRADERLYEAKRARSAPVATAEVAVAEPASAEPAVAEAAETSLPIGPETAPPARAPSDLTRAPREEDVPQPRSWFRRLFG